MTPTQKKETVHVIDDDPDVRDALDSFLRSENYAVVLHSTSSSFRKAYDSSIPSCILLDVRLEAEDGLDILEALNTSTMTVPVIIMTGHGDVPMAVRGMKNGAVDFLLKPFSDHALLEALTVAFSKTQTLFETQEQQRSRLEKWATLSPREQEVMRYAASGLMNKQIAALMGIELVTVKVHRGKAMRKLHAKSFAEIVRFIEHI